MRCCGYTLTDFSISIRRTSLALWQSNDCLSASKATLMNMDKYFMWIHYERLHNHNKAKHNKTMCIFLGIYCMVCDRAWLGKVNISSICGGVKWERYILFIRWRNLSHRPLMSSLEIACVKYVYSKFELFVKGWGSKHISPIGPKPTINQILHMHFENWLKITQAIALGFKSICYFLMPD